MANNKKIRTTDGTVQIFDREIGAVDFAEGQVRKFDIKERPNQIKQIKLHCRIGLTQNAGDLAASPDAPFNIIRNIKVRPSQGTVLKEFPGLMINFLNDLEFGTVAYNTAPPALAPAGTPFEFAFDVIIPFEDHTNIFSERTILNTMSYNDLTLFITWGTIGDMFPGWTGPAGTDVIDYFYCDVLALERPPLSVAEETITRQVMYDNIVRDALIAETPVLLPENTMLKTLLLVARDENGARSNALVERLKVQYDSGDYEIFDMRAGAVQSSNKQYYHVENIAVGVYAIEFDIMHDYRTLFKTKDRNFARLIVEAVTPLPEDATLEVFRRRIATQKVLTR